MRMAGAQQKLIVDALWPPGLRHGVAVWAVLDGARDQRIFSAVDGSRLNRCCLYSGSLPWQLQVAAPYLVELEPDSGFTKFLIDEGWGNSWGFFLRTGAGMKQLRRHLHGLLVAREQRGRNILFRWYDPRVLRVYLPTCWPAELEQFYGPIQWLALEGEDPRELMEYQYDGRRLIETRRSAGGAVDGKSRPTYHELGTGEQGGSPGQRHGMLTIRNAQMQVLAKPAHRIFEQRAADHLARSFPHLPESGDQRQLRARVRRGMEEASLYGIESERDLLRWLNVGAALGEDFAANPRYPWAARILSSPLSPSSMAERLSQTALDVVHDLALRESLPPEPPAETSSEEEESEEESWAS